MIQDIQAAINLGLGICGTILGDNYLWMRANGPNYPTMREKALGVIVAQFSTDPGLTFLKPSQYGKPDWYGACDPTLLQNGDYLAGPLGTFFLTAEERLNVPHFIKCNHFISIARATDTEVAGSDGSYAGQAVDSAQPFMAGWPAYSGQLSTGKGANQTGLALPSDAKTADLEILLPKTAPVIRFNDILTDDTGMRATINSVELTSLGYRLSASVWAPA